MVKGFQPKAPPAEIRAALESFHHGVWAKHGQSVTLRYMVGQGTLGASGGLRLGSSLEGPALHPEPTGASRPSGGSLSGAVAPPEPCLDALKV